MKSKSEEIVVQQKIPKKTPMWSIILIAALVILAVVLVVLFGIDRVLFRLVISTIASIGSTIKS